MRTNQSPKGGSPKNGSIVPRVPRRRTAPSEAQESAAGQENSEQISVQDQIARRAYAIWEARAGTGGSAEEDWCRAEQEILARSNG